MKKRSVYNEIMYGLCELFPKEHGNFVINNSDCSFTYSKFSDSGELFYGEMNIADDGNSIIFDVFKTRDTGDDVQVLHFSWWNVAEMRSEVERIEGYLEIIEDR